MELSETGLTNLFQATNVSSPAVRDATCAKMLSFSQNTAMFAESQELGTQDFATPSHRRAHLRPSQAGSQPAVDPTLHGPPTVDPHGKRRRPFMESQSHRDAEVQQKCKKMRALAGKNASPVLDLCTCTAEEAEELDVAHLLTHHCVSSGSRGSRSYEHTFQELGSLGQGEFGEVVRVRNMLDLSESAVKMTAAGRQLSDAELKRCLFEAQVMGRVSSACPAALQLREMWVESMTFKNERLYRVFMRMELCHDSLGARLRRGDSFDERALHLILTQVASVLATMHGLGLAHLDVKPDNILQAQPDTYKLGDFGLATRLDGAWPIDEGDRKYVSQELLAGDHRNLAAADVFSLGLSLYELATHAELPDGGDMYERLRNGAAVKNMRGFSEPFAQIVHRMLAPDPSHRPSAAELQAWAPANSRASSDSEHTGRHGGAAAPANNRPSCTGSAGAGGTGGDRTNLCHLFSKVRPGSSSGSKDPKRKAAGDSKPGKRKEALKPALPMRAVHG